jgi:DNA-binding XRE family transcriptional regulator
MIKNDTEYEYSQECARKFADSIVALEQNNNNPDNWELQRTSLQSHLDALKVEIVEYEMLVSYSGSQPLKIKVDSLNKFSDALIKARIAAKINQRELALRLGIDEQRIQQYENTDYQCASFVEILEVSAVLGVEFETATVQVDFEEIKAVKQSVDKWQRAKTNIKTKAS